MRASAKYAATREKVQAAIDARMIIAMILEKQSPRSTTRWCLILANEILEALKAGGFCVRLGHDFVKTGHRDRECRACKASEIRW